MSGVVVLYGSLGASSAIWDLQLPVLEGKRVIRIEHPGHGDAPLSPVHDVGDLAARALADAGTERFTFVGLSLGAAVGLRIAIDAPDRVEQLVLACTCARFGESAQWVDRAAKVRAEGLESIVDAVLARWFTPAFDDVPPYRELFLETDPEGYARCCEALARYDVRDEIAAITAPTLLIAGAEDPTAPPSGLAAIRDKVGGSRLEVIDGAAHLANVEQPDAFNKLLEEVL